MKKLGLFFVGLLALLCMGCGSHSSPENAIKAYYSALQQGDYDNAATYLYSGFILKGNEVAKMLEDAYSKDNMIASFDVMGSAYSTNDKAQVAVAFEVAKPLKGADAKEVVLLDLVKIDGSWYIVGMN